MKRERDLKRERGAIWRGQWGSDEKGCIREDRVKHTNVPEDLTVEGRSRAGQGGADDRGVASPEVTRNEAIGFFSFFLFW